MIGLGLAAVVALWLIFSMMRKMFGLALLAAIALGAWLLWSNPELLGNLPSAAMRFMT